MLTSLQNTESRRTADGILPRFYFPTDVSGRVLPLFSGGRPRRPTSSHSARDIRPTGLGSPNPKVTTRRKRLMPTDEELEVSHPSPPSAPVRQHRHVRARSAPTPRIALTPPLQRLEPPCQALLFPCDASGVVLPLFHPSTSTPGSPRPWTATTAASLGNPCTPLPCNASGAVLGFFGQPVMTDGSDPVPVDAVGGGDGGDGDEEVEEVEKDSIESVIEWIDEMLGGCRVVGEGSGKRKRRRGTGGEDNQEVLEWLEGLRFEA